MDALGQLAASVGEGGGEITTASLSAALGALLAGAKGNGNLGARGGERGESSAAESSMELLQEALGQLQSGTFEEALGGLERRQAARAALAAGGGTGEGAIQLNELTIAKESLAAIMSGKSQATEMSVGELLMTAAEEEHFDGGHRCVVSR